MGKKKSFIDKKKSVTFNLFYGATEDVDDGPERVLVDVNKGVGIGRPDPAAAAEAAEAAAASGRRYGPNHPLAWLEETNAVTMTEERRRLNLEYGFQDDGYDYLKHTRATNDVSRSAVLVGGRSASGGEGAEGGAQALGAGEVAPEDQVYNGPSVFVPAPKLVAPSADVRTFDATKLWLAQPAGDEEDAAQQLGGVTAFARETDAVRGHAREELEELERMMAQFEDASEAGGDDDDEAGRAWGDLEEDFVLEATQVVAAAAAAGGEGLDGRGLDGRFAEDSEGEEGSDDFEEVSSADEFSEYADSEEEGAEGGLGGRTRGGGSGSSASASERRRVSGGSIASTYWRPERTDRKEALSVIDERFERLALEYEDDDIGDLEEQADVIAGPVGDPSSAFGDLLDDFLKKHGENKRGREAGLQLIRRLATTQEAAEELDEFEEEAQASRGKARELLALYESMPEERQTVALEGIMTQQRERWDCESVLSRLTNTDNHPGRIGAPSRRRAPSEGTAASGAAGAAAGPIRLSDKGIPLGYAPIAVRARSIGKGGAAAAAAGDVSSLGSAAIEQASAAEPPTPPAPPTARRKGETPEERRARKSAVKEAKRSSRMAKKELKEAFKEQASLQQRRVATGGITVSTIPIS